LGCFRLTLPGSELIIIGEPLRVSSYSADQIQVLEGLEPVRKRPGCTSAPPARGLHHLVYEVVDNSVDEALAGYCTHVEVELNADGSVTVTDDGRGIPTDTHLKPANRRGDGTPTPEASLAVAATRFLVVCTVLVFLSSTPCPRWWKLQFGGISGYPTFERGVQLLN